MRNDYSYPEPDGVENRVAEEAAAYESEGLPNRLLNAREVAKFVGCHEETVRRAYLRGLLVSQRFGVRGRRFHPADVLDWIRRGIPTKFRNRKEDPYGCSKALSQQRLQIEPALRASVVVGCHAQPRTVSDACR